MPTMKDREPSFVRAWVPVRCWYMYVDDSGARVEIYEESPTQYEVFKGDEAYFGTYRSLEEAQKAVEDYYFNEGDGLSLRT